MIRSKKELLSKRVCIKTCWSAILALLFIGLFSASVEPPEIPLIKVVGGVLAGLFFIPALILYIYALKDAFKLKENRTFWILLLFVCFIFGGLFYWTYRLKELK